MIYDFNYNVQYNAIIYLYFTNILIGVSVGTPSTPVWTPSFSMASDGSALYQLNISSSISYAPFVSLMNMSALVMNSHSSPLNNYGQVGNSQVHLYIKISINRGTIN